MAEKRRAPCIVFYSYKGGTGKTVSTVQMGAALAELGRRVCLVDFDLEAPGLAIAAQVLLQLKGPMSADAYNALGLVDYIEDFAEAAKEKGWLKTCACGHLIPTKLLDAEELVATLPPVNTKASSVQWGKKKGRVHWISAGRLGMGIDQVVPSYWEKLHSNPVQAVIENNDWSAPFFRALLDRIREDLEIDYIIVDSRSGVNELSGVCTRAIADKLVLLTGLQEEGYYGTNLVLRSLQAARAQHPCAGPAMENIFIAASRVPEVVLSPTGSPIAVLREGADARRSSHALKWDDKREMLRARLFEDVRNESRLGVSILASTPNLEWEQQLVIQASGNPTPASTLSEDYVDLFAAILGPAEPTIKAELSRLIRKNYKLRPYYIDESAGTIINPDDGSDNVAFKVSTYVGTLESICRSIERGVRRSNKLASPSQVKRGVDAALFSAGDSAAEEFSTYLAQERFAGRERNVENLWGEVREWCGFDSTVGFGRFEAEPWGEGAVEGRIVVHNNFLVRDRTREERNLCSFLAGYMKRVLSSIYAPQTVSVTHDVKTACGQYKPSRRSGEPEPCVFTFAVGAGSARKRSKKGA